MEFPYTIHLTSPNVNVTWGQFSNLWNWQWVIIFNNFSEHSKILLLAYIWEKNSILSLFIVHTHKAIL